MHTYLHAYVHAYKHAYIHIYMHACMYVCMHANMHTNSFVHSFSHSPINPHPFNSVVSSIHSLTRLLIHSIFIQIHSSIHSLVYSFIRQVSIFGLQTDIWCTDKAGCYANGQISRGHGNQPHPSGILRSLGGCAFIRRTGDGRLGKHSNALTQLLVRTSHATMPPQPANQ